MHKIPILTYTDVYTLCIYTEEISCLEVNVPFAHDSPHVHLHAADLTDLYTHSTGWGPIPEAGSIDSHGGILNTGPPG